MPEAPTSPDGPDRNGSRADPLGWWPLTPSVSIAVFLLVALFTMDANGSSRTGLALIAGVVIGPPVSYLLNTYWPRTARKEGSTTEASPGAKP